MCYPEPGGTAAPRTPSHGTNALVSEFMYPLCVRLWRTASRESLTE